MADTPQTFEDIEAQTLACLEGNEAEQRRLTMLSQRDHEAYRDEVNRLWIQFAFNVRFRRVMNKARGQGTKKKGSHGEGRHG